MRNQFPLAERFVQAGSTYVETEAERSGLIPITLVQNPNGKRKDAALETATYITRLQEGPMSTCIPMKWVKWANQAQIRE